MEFSVMMKLALALAGTAALTFASAGHAAVVVGSGSGTNLLTLSGPGTPGSGGTLTGSGGTVATISGGQVLNTDQPFADIPEAPFGGTFLSVGPTSGQPATLAFTTPVNFLSFAIGSPDTYNLLTIVTNMGSQTFTAAMLGLPTDGNQGFTGFVNFTGVAGDLIKSVTFTNSPSINAFETASFSVTAVPEPGTWAMMLLGFAGMGAAMRRSRKPFVAQLA